MPGGTPIEPLRDPDWVYDLDDEVLSLPQRARKLIAAWADVHGGWDRAMAAELDAMQPALVVRDAFDGTCRRCGGRPAGGPQGSLWVCVDCGWHAEVVGDQASA